MISMVDILPMLNVNQMNMQLGVIDTQNQMTKIVGCQSAQAQQYQAQTTVKQ